MLRTIVVMVVQAMDSVELSIRGCGSRLPCPAPGRWAAGALAALSVPSVEKLWVLCLLLMMRTMLVISFVIIASGISVAQEFSREVLEFSMN